LRFGAASTGLDVHETVVLVGRVGKHAAEFHRGDARFERAGILLDGDDGGFIVFFARHVEEFARVTQTLVDFGDGNDDTFQRFFLASQRLGAWRIVPDGRIFENLADFNQLGLFSIEVKDTSVARRRGPEGR